MSCGRRKLRTLNKVNAACGGLYDALYMVSYYLSPPIYGVGSLNLYALCDVYACHGLGMNPSCH